ncbi:4-demethylwyosine synthase TYW1 [Candidatus Micrarchaeota archaeon]|nr:4-demethylwyosine synthase TYW1 [Candidatus Micrarchaeota archaeon]
MEKKKPKSSPFEFVGSTQKAAVQTCLWTRKALLGEGFCYKHAFYGIQSHRCIQWSPCVAYCNLACRFCWRDTPVHAPVWEGAVDEPSELAEGAINAFKHLLNGYPGNPKTIPERFKEAMEPKHSTMSLDGEPTLYPRLGELIKEFDKRKMTTFLVSNGTNPEALEKLAEEKAMPTQLYVSCSSYDEETFRKNQNPLQEGLWEKYLETLELMSTLPHNRRVLRMTLGKGLNLENAKAYAKLVELSGAEYVEVKGYSALGKSRARMGPAYVPTHEEIVSFAKELREETGYLASEEHVPSKVALLCKNEKAKSKRMLKF